MASPAPRAPSWARKRPASTRCGSRSRASQPGQSDIVLVGGAHNGERKDLLLLYEFGGHAAEGHVRAGVGARARGGGMALGSLGAFLVLEEREHAEARGAKPLARLATRAVGPQPPAARRGDGGACADVAQARAAAASRPRRGHLRRDRRRARDRGGARLPRHASRRSGARHRHLSSAMGSSRNSP